MSNNNYDMLPQTKESLSHILKHYELYRKERKQSQPMIVGISGCQGSGKTTLCDTLSHLLKEAPYNLRVVNFSLDDVYLTHKDQVALSKRYPNNVLYQQRGQAGSHDLNLLQDTFQQLLNNKEKVPIPVYDKSCFGGQGDRLPKEQWKYPLAPFDIVLFEGWMLGFKPIKSLPEDIIGGGRCTQQDASVMNTLLKDYDDNIYPYLDIFIHLSPLNLVQVYDWRLQQEHYMKKTRGVQGLSDDQVKLFVDTYMPAYQLYLPRLDSIGFFGFDTAEKRKGYEGLERKDGGYSQHNRHLKIVLNGDRRVVEVKTLKEEEEENIVAKAPTAAKGIVLTRRLVFRCAFIGVLGIIGYKRKSIVDTLVKLFNKK